MWSPLLALPLLLRLPVVLALPLLVVRLLDQALARHQESRFDGSFWFFLYGLIWVPNGVQKKDSPRLTPRLSPHLRKAFKTEAATLHDPSDGFLSFLLLIAHQAFLPITLSSFRGRTNKP